MIDISQAVVSLFHHLWSSVPSRSASTFIQLVTAVLVSHGHMSDALLSGICNRHWTSYYKWLRAGRWSYLAVARACVKLVVNNLPDDWIVFAIDDTTIYRKSKKAPRVGTLHEHGTKANRPTYVNGQCVVSLACVVQNMNLQCIALPILSCVARRVGNRNKLIAAQALFRSVRSVVAKKRVRVLMDAWYMRGRLVLYLLEEGMEVIGQVRRDTALFHPPKAPPKGKRGRKPKKGERVYLADVEQKRFQQIQMKLYGREVLVHYRSEELVARFLNYRLVRVVWSRLEDLETGEVGRTSIIICSSVARSPIEILSYYSERWSIEPMFNAIKNQWGFAKAWQQHCLSLSRWLSIISTSYFIPAFLLAFYPEQAKAVAFKAPWRREEEVTVSTVTAGLRLIIVGLGIEGQIRKTEEIRRMERCRESWWQYRKAA